MAIRHYLLAALAALALSGCGIKRTNIPDTASMPQGSGVMVARVVFVQRNAAGDEPAPALTAIKTTNLTVASLILDLHPGENFTVMSLPAGNYTWRGLYVGRRNSEFRNRLPFEIQAGKINYVGDIVVTLDWNDLTRYGMRVRSNLAASETYVHEVYPQLSGHYPMVASLTEDDR
ncbi:hypothetical protein ACXU4B_14635 [Dyella soli]|uniref:Uncharacterized protein n=1 Tax=Dyella soli TaxID=522319 RepID=A0A4R0YNH5_9GAMM|nr:hypothetical protein [Dyella soli]TCI09117.1 hypothetical protein EZM97_23040 [Dyella soli]